VEWPDFLDSPKEIMTAAMTAASALGIGHSIRRGGPGRLVRNVLTGLAKIPMYSYQEEKARQATEWVAWYKTENERLATENRQKDQEIARLRAASSPASDDGSSAPPTSTSTPTPTRAPTSSAT
jgi:hypothetical protein